VSLHDSRDTVVLVVVDTTVMVVLRDVDVVLDDELLLDVALLDVGDVDVVLDDELLLDVALLDVGDVDVVLDDELLLDVALLDVSDVDVVLDDELLLDVALLDVGDVDVVLLVVVVGLGRGFGSSRIRLVQSTSSVFCSSPVWASITRTAVRMSSTYSHV
jgi:hypothetical protein